MREPHRDEIAWEDALAKAAIKKEKVERRFVEPKPGERPPANPFLPPTIPLPPALNRTSPQLWFEDVAKHVTQDKRPQEPPDNIRGAATRIWTAYNKSHNARAFAAALDEQGISLAVVSKEEADRSHRENTFAKEIGRFAPTYHEGEIVAVTDRAQVYRLSERATSDTRAEVEKLLAPLDPRIVAGH